MEEEALIVKEKHPDLPPDNRKCVWIALLPLSKVSACKKKCGLI